MSFSCRFQKHLRDPANTVFRHWAFNLIASVRQAFWRILPLRLDFWRDEGNSSSMADRVLEVAYSLCSDDPSLRIDFSLSPNIVGRLGSSPDADISIPLIGVEAEECQLTVDDSGFLWLTRGSDAARIRVSPPEYLHIGPYRFLIRETPKTEFSHSRGENRDLLLPDKNTKKSLNSQKWRVIACSAVGSVILTGTLIYVTKNLDKSASDPKKATDEVVRVGKDIDAANDENKTRTEADDPQVPDPITSKGKQESIDLEKVAFAVSPCVYLIQVVGANGQVIGTGTGFNLSSDGLIVTNYHVIEQGQTFSIITNQGARFDQAQVVVEDPVSDLALLKINGANLPFLNLSQTGEVAVGMQVAVYGSPEGLSGTLSEGIISAIPKNLKDKFPTDVLPNKGVLIQTTAAISPGSSGSPLLDREGRVLGVMTMIMRGQGNAQSLNFAVPVEALKQLLEIPKEDWLSTGIRRGIPGEAGQDSDILSELTPPDDATVIELTKKMEANAWVDALKIANALAEKFPKSAYAHFQNGNCALILRLDQQAELSYRKALEISPKSYIVWNNLGTAIRSQRKYAQALEAFEKSVSLNPENVNGWKNIILMNVVLRNWAKATAALETLTKLDLLEAKKTAQFISKYHVTNESFRSLVIETSNTVIIEPIPEDMIKYRVQGVKEGDKLSVRDGPGSKFPVNAELDNGTLVFVVGKPEFNGTTEWLPIEYGNFTGWVVSKFLVKAEH